MTIKHSDFKDQIIIQAMSVSFDASGNSIETWNDVIILWTKYQKVYSKLKQDGQSSIREELYEFVVRTPDPSDLVISYQDKILCNGIRLDISEIKELQNNFLKIYCLGYHVG